MPKKTHILQGLKTSYSHLILFQHHHLFAKAISIVFQCIEIQARALRVAVAVCSVPHDLFVTAVQTIVLPYQLTSHIEYHQPGITGGNVETDGGGGIEWIGIV